MKAKVVFKFGDKVKLLLEDGRKIQVPMQLNRAMKYGDTGTIIETNQSVRFVLDSTPIGFTMVRTPDIIPTPKSESKELICVN